MNPSVSIRALRGCLILLTLAVAASASAAEVSIVRAFTGWRDAASFKRISEYFDGRENTGGETMLRTHADQRAGYYFLVRTANAGAPLPVTARIEIILPSAAKTKVFTFSADLKTGSTVLNLGLTGADWPDAKANPVAWKLELLAADGRVLATEKSYLWEKPGAK
jgi:hypothetical protein